MTREEALQRADEVVRAYVQQQPIGREAPHRLLVEFIADAIQYGFDEARRRSSSNASSSSTEGRS